MTKFTVLLVAVVAVAVTLSDALIFDLLDKQGDDDMMGEIQNIKNSYFLELHKRPTAGEGGASGRTLTRNRLAHIRRWLASIDAAERQPMMNKRRPMDDDAAM